MGSVALVGMGANGRDRGTRALGVATVVLLLLDPGLATAIGFALSVLATAGILLLAPGWRDALTRWLPRWLAEAVAVPRGRPARLHAADRGDLGPGQPGRGAGQPAGGAGGRAGHRPGAARRPAHAGRAAGRPVGAAWPAGWCVPWIVEVARHMASLPTAGRPLGERTARDRGPGPGERWRSRCSDRAWCDGAPPGWRAAGCSSRPSWCGCRRPAGRPRAG